MDFCILAVLFVADRSARHLAQRFKDCFPLKVPLAIPLLARGAW